MIVKRRALTSRALAPQRTSKCSDSQKNSPHPFLKSREMLDRFHLFLFGIYYVLPPQAELLPTAMPLGQAHFAALIPSATLAAGLLPL